MSLFFRTRLSSQDDQTKGAKILDFDRAARAKKKSGAQSSGVPPKGTAWNKSRASSHSKAPISRHNPHSQSDSNGAMRAGAAFGNGRARNSKSLRTHAKVHGKNVSAFQFKMAQGLQLLGGALVLLVVFKGCVPF